MFTMKKTVIGLSVAIIKCGVKVFEGSVVRIMSVISSVEKSFSIRIIKVLCLPDLRMKFERISFGNKVCLSNLVSVIVQQMPN